MHMVSLCRSCKYVYNGNMENNICDDVSCSTAISLFLPTRNSDMHTIGVHTLVVVRCGAWPDE